MVSVSQLLKFMELYERHFHRPITREAAMESAMKLLSMVKATYRPITQQDIDGLSLAPPGSE